jgi:8-oxo-dGTP diphosphatase
MMSTGVESKQAVMCVVVRQGRFLLIKRGATTRMPGIWCHVSGRLEANESLEEAAERELEEEVGLKGSAIRKIARTYTENNEYELHWFLMDIISGDAVIASDEVSDLCWVTLEEYEQLLPKFEKNFETLKHLSSNGVFEG